MNLASKVGVDAPSVQLRRAGDIDYILVKRYDRFLSESGEVEKIKFLDQIIFNYLVGNLDAHGKNFSLLHHSPGRIELAPLYDCLCLTLYQKHSTEMAMKIGDTFASSNVTKADWELFSEKVEIKYRLVKSTMARLSSRILDQFKKWKPSSKFEDEWATQLKEQCTGARRRLDL